MSAANAGKLLLAALIDDEHPLSKISNPEAKGEYLLKTGEQNAFAFIREHLIEMGVAPARETILDETGVTIPASGPEPFEYYLKKVRAKYLHNTLGTKLNDARVSLNEGTPADEVLAEMTELVHALHLDEAGGKVVNFKEDAHDLLKAGYLESWDGENTGVPTGWPSLDKKMGGLKPGDFMSLIGRPAAGKTYLLLYMALYGWKHFGYRPLFISMEMSPLLISQRLAAMDLGMPITPIKNFDLDTKQKEKVFSGLKQLTTMDRPDFYVVDGNLTATVDEILTLVRELKPDVVFVDGAYLMSHPNKRLSKWDRISDNAEWLKMACAGALKTPVVASYQFNKSLVSDKRKGISEGLEHVYGSDVIGQISSVALGLMQEDGIETKKSREVRVLKGRSGESGKFDIHWLFDEYPFMDFSEVISQADQDIAEAMEEANAPHGYKPSPKLKHLS